MASRSDLHNKLIDIVEEVVGEITGDDKQVYFQPPESIKIKYPCIIYSLDNHENVYADGIKYGRKKAYMVTAIDYDPDSKFVDLLEKLPYSKFDRSYTSDNLNHFVFTILNKEELNYGNI